MTYIRKTRDTFETQGYYSSCWECVTCDETLKEARESIACYRENEPMYPFRIKKVREVK